MPAPFATGARLCEAAVLALGLPSTGAFPAAGAASTREDCSSTAPGAVHRREFPAGRRGPPRRPASSGGGAAPSLLAATDPSATPGARVALSRADPSPIPGVALSPAEASRALTAMKKALRRARARGRAGHWTYDLARHLSLAQGVRRAEAAARADLFARRDAPAGGDESARD